MLFSFFSGYLNYTSNFQTCTGLVYIYKYIQIIFRIVPKMKAQPDHPMTFLLHKMRIPQNANLLEKKPLRDALMFSTILKQHCFGLIILKGLQMNA